MCLPKVYLWETQRARGREMDRATRDKSQNHEINGRAPKRAKPTNLEQGWICFDEGLLKAFAFRTGWPVTPLVVRNVVVNVVSTGSGDETNATRMKARQPRLPSQLDDTFAELQSELGALVHECSGQRSSEATDMNTQGMVGIQLEM